MAELDSVQEADEKETSEPRLPLSWSAIAMAADECSVKDLKETARLLDGVKISGSKQELIDRLKRWAGEDEGRFREYFGEVSLEDGSPAVAEELRAVDMAPLQELLQIRREREVYAERLLRLSESAGEHSTTVVDRVRRDYEARIEVLEERSRSPLEAARQSYGQLRTHLESFEQEHREALLEKEELTLRHDVGELGAADFQTRIAGCKARLEQREIRLQQAQRLKDRFVEAVGSEEDLEGTLSVAPSADREIGEEERETAAAPDHPVAREAVTVVARQQALPVAEEGAVEGATIIVRPARLISRREEGTQEEYRLGPVETLIGRSIKADIRVVAGTVSRLHAKVIFGAEGFIIADLGSENGTLVNDQRIEERLLEEGDVVRIGPAEFEFRQG